MLQRAGWCAWATTSTGAAQLCLRRARAASMRKRDMGSGEQLAPAYVGDIPTKSHKPSQAFAPQAHMPIVPHSSLLQRTSLGEGLAAQALHCGQAVHQLGDRSF